MDTSKRTVGDAQRDYIFWEKTTEWIDTPFVHQQSTPWGCDCVGIVIAVAASMGYDLTSADDPARPISAISDQLQQRVELMAVKADEYMQGCLLLFRVGRYVQHLAVWNDGRIIHTDRTMRSVKMIDYHAELESRLAGIYVLDWQSIPRCEPLYSDIK